MANQLSASRLIRVYGREREKREREREREREKERERERKKDIYSYLFTRRYRKISFVGASLMHQ